MTSGGLRLAAFVLVGSGGATSEPILYIDIAADLGITDMFPNGGKQSKEGILETSGSGAAFLDCNADGFQDAFIVSGPGGTNRLSENRASKRFEDATARLGLRSEGPGPRGLRGRLRQRRIHRSIRNALGPEWALQEHRRPAFRASACNRQRQHGMRIC